MKCEICKINTAISGYYTYYLWHLMRGRSVFISDQLKEIYLCKNCNKHYREIFIKIDIPEYIPIEQYKQYLIKKINVESNNKTMYKL